MKSNRFPFEDTLYKRLCKTLSSIFSPMSSNICLICKKYNTTSGALSPRERNVYWIQTRINFMSKLDQKIIDFNRANSEIPRYKIVISGRDFDEVFMVDTSNLPRAIEESKLIVITTRNLTLIDARFLRVNAQILPLS